MTSEMRNNIAIVLEDVIYNHETACLSSYLKEKKFNVKYFFWKSSKNILDKIQNFKPDHIYLPTEVRAHGGTAELLNILEISKKIKSILKNVKVTLFGRLSTILNEEILKRYEIVDHVLVGDPEYPLEKLASGIKPSEIDGLVFRDTERGEIVSNKIGKQTDLKNLPMPDFDEFFSITGADKMGFYVPVSRGCFYRCTFCQNATTRREVNAEGKSGFRYYDSEWCLKSLEYLKSKYGPIENFYFTDSIFTFDKKFMSEFLTLYKSRIGVPYVIATRMNLIDDDISRLLKDSGCSKVNFGIECGVEKTRNFLLKKAETDKHLIEGLKSCKKFGLRTAGNVILGLPDETFNDAIESLKKSVEFDPDILNIYLFQPYYGTELTDYSIKKGYLDKDFTKWDRTGSKNQGVLALDLPDKKKIENLMLLGPLFRVMPFVSLFKILCRLPKNRLFLFTYHLPRIVRGLTFELGQKSLMRKFGYLLNCFYRIFILGVRPFNR